MKPLLQKLPKTEQTSFVARTYTTPMFETGWHQHPEYELVLQRRGSGMCFIGNYIGNFKEGDIFLLGSNLPHQFKKAKPGMKCSVMVIHFDKDFWGQAFWLMPESSIVLKLLDQSMLAIKLSIYKTELAAAILQLESATGFKRVVLLCECLLMISEDAGKQTLSTINNETLSLFEDDKINKLFEHTIKHFKEPISLATVAGIAAMSISAFCRYFKRNTKKTYIEFVIEMRISHACHSLLTTDKTILEICYDCGFNTVANFNKQFLKIKGVKPSHYKRQFRSS